MKLYLFTTAGHYLPAKVLVFADDANAAAKLANEALLADSLPLLNDMRVLVEQGCIQQLPIENDTVYMVWNGDY